VRGFVRQLDDAQLFPCFVEDLDADSGCAEQIAVTVERHTVRPGFELLVIFKPVEPLAKVIRSDIF